MNGRLARTRRACLRYLLVAVICSLTPQCVFAADRFLVRSWQPEDGLPSSIIRALAQAADGFLWVGTAEGTVRFDGIRFSRFPGERDGLLARRSPSRIFALPGGDVWIATARGGLLRWEDGRGFTVIWDDDQSVERSRRIVGRVVSDGSSGVFIERGTEELYHAAKSAQPQVLEKTPENLEKLRVAVEAQWQPSAAAALGLPLELRSSDGRIWTRTPEGGLSVSDGSSEGMPVSLPEFSAGSRVTSLLEGREGNIWVGTSGNGLFQVRAPRVSVFDATDGLSDAVVSAILEDRTGALWAGNRSGGVDRIVDGKVTRFEVGGVEWKYSVSALCEDAAGTIWAATYGSSVYRWEGGRFRPASDFGMTARRVRAIVSDANGALWLGGEEGLDTWENGVLTHHGVDEGVPEREITALAIDSTGEIWGGTMAGALFHSHDGRFSVAANLDGSAVSSLLQDEEGAIWATTLGAGLFRLKGNELTRFAEREGLPDQRLTCVLDDRAGHLWLGSLAGIFRAAKSELHEVAAHRRSSVQWIQFDREDGMLSRECAGGIQPAGLRSSNGTLRFPTVNGIVAIQPNALKPNTIPPRVAIEEARVHDRNWETGIGVLRAGPGSARLELRYTALSFVAPERVRFRTRLEGLEDEWRDLGTQRSAVYQAVPPGEYRFHVVAANADGVWSDTAAALAIVVEPHFWETGWFKIGAAAFAGALALGIGAMASRARWKTRMLRIEAETAREKERARIARDMHDELGASLTRIALMSDLAAYEPPGAAGTEKQFAEIAKAARTVSSTLDQIVWTVDPRNDTIERLVGYIGEFATEYLEGTGISLQLELPPGAPAIAVASDVRHEVLLGVKESLNNVVKYASASTVTVRVAYVNEVLEIMVADDGRGFDLAAISTYSNGLRNMQQRFATLGGSAQIESQPGAGTTVRFRIPLA